MTMTPSEASQVKKLRAALEPAIPREWQSRWQGVAGWFWLSEDEKGIGAGAQAFDADGNATGFSFPVKPLRDTVSILRLMHPEADRHQWQTVLVRFGRRAKDLSVEFEYDDPLRWVVTPENYSEMREILRPRFSEASKA